MIVNKRGSFIDIGCCVYKFTYTCVSVNEAYLECKLNLLHGVTAGPTLGLIPSIHLQRHCQSVRAASQKKKGERGRSPGWIGKDGKEGRGEGGGDRCKENRV